MMTLLSRGKSFGLGVYGQTVTEVGSDGTTHTRVVLNERAVRAGAGVTYVLGMLAFFHAWYLHDQRFIMALVPLLFFDFFTKVVVGIRFSPLSQLARWLVRHQRPEPIPAAPKRFAWGIGLGLSGSMLILLYAFGLSGPATAGVCIICLVMMWCESALGICLGCRVYDWLMQQ